MSVAEICRRKICADGFSRHPFVRALGRPRIQMQIGFLAWNHHAGTIYPQFLRFAPKMAPKSKVSYGFPNRSPSFWLLPHLERMSHQPPRFGEIRSTLVLTRLRVPNFEIIRVKKTQVVDASSLHQGRKRISMSQAEVSLCSPAGLGSAALSWGSSSVENEKMFETTSHVVSDCIHSWYIICANLTTSSGICIEHRLQKLAENLPSLL